MLTPPEPDGSQALNPVDPPNLDPRLVDLFEMAKATGRTPLIQPEAGTYTAGTGLRWASDPAPPTPAEQEAAAWARAQRW
jgi:hypothetical protein